MANINDMCIGCGTCVAINDKLFKIEEGKAKVVKQPETDEEKASYEQAKASCPVGAIE